MQETIQSLRDAIESLNDAYNDCPDPDEGDEIYKLISEIERIIRRLETA